MATSKLVGTADASHKFMDSDYHSNDTVHASDVVWQLDPTSTLRPLGMGPNDPVKVFLPVSGTLDWSIEALVQGNFTNTCTINDSGTASLASGDENNIGYLYLIGSGPTATYIVEGDFGGFPIETCLESENQKVDDKWVTSDPGNVPVVAGSDDALVLDGSYTLEGTQFGATVSDKYSWRFHSAP